MNPFRLARFEAGLSIRSAAEKAGVSKQTILSLEQEHVEAPRAETVKKLADAYGVTVRALLGEEAAA